MLTIGKLKVNASLAGDELAEIVNSRYGSIDFEWGIASASTDFVSYICRPCVLVLGY